MQASRAHLAAGLAGAGAALAAAVVLLHFVGRLPSRTSPWPVGPRNSGQSSAMAKSVCTTASALRDPEVSASSAVNVVCAMEAT